MSRERSSFFRRAVITMLAATVCCVPLLGCGKSPERTPEEVEQQHQQHREYSQREVEESGAR